MLKTTNSEHLTTYDVILKKIKQCCDLISLLANQRGSIDSFMMKLPENPKQVNFWQSIKKSPRIDALIFDVVQIGKAEQLRAARVVQSMENYCKDRNEKIVETVVVDELLESLLELEALRMQHAEVLKILHAQSKENCT